MKSKDRELRIVGVCLIVAGGLMMFYFCYLPFQAARNHEPGVELSPKINIFAPVFLLLGIFAAATGEKGRDLLTDEVNHKVRLWGWLFIAGAFAISIGFDHWLQSAFRSLGYMRP